MFLFVTEHCIQYSYMSIIQYSYMSIVHELLVTYDELEPNLDQIEPF